MSMLKSNCLQVKMTMLFWDLLLLVTLSCEFRVHRAGSQLKMSECQTKAGNPEFPSLNVFENFDSFENIEDDP